jgi:hypothetical protein
MKYWKEEDGIVYLQNGNKEIVKVSDELIEVVSLLVEHRKLYGMPIIHPHSYGDGDTIWLSFKDFQDVPSFKEFSLRKYFWKDLDLMRETILKINGKKK